MTLRPSMFCVLLTFTSTAGVLAGSEARQVGSRAYANIECLESARHTERDEFVRRSIDKALIALREKFADEFEGPKLKRRQRKKRDR